MHIVRVKLLTENGTCRYLAWCSALNDIARTVIMIILLSGILSLGASSIVCTETNHYPSWYDLRCCQGVKLQQSANLKSPWVRTVTSCYPSWYDVKPQQTNYSKISLTDHHHRLTTPLYRSNVSQTIAYTIPLWRYSNSLNQPPP